MSEPESSEQQAVEAKKGFSGSQVLLIVVAVFLVTVVGSILLIRTYIFPADFRPVTLSALEQEKLDTKLEVIGITVDRNSGTSSVLRAEAYSEAGASRDVSFSEKEINSLIAADPQLATKLAIDFSDDLASATMLIPLDPDFPVMGGKTVRIATGVELAFANGRPVVALKGVSIMGVPVPNAWLGNLKNVDLVSEFGADEGFWQGFADGVDEIRVRDGQLQITLKE